ncbi:ATP-binding protein [Streptomyces sp. NPDC088141]|uniref:GAF domain-containing sensor histidine kinase n=1 Tax=Streptomyces sp. NPDC088141 TaxID=3155179 RepID=UPI003412D302
MVAHRARCRIQVRAVIWLPPHIPSARTCRLPETMTPPDDGPRLLARQAEMRADLSKALNAVTSTLEELLPEARCSVLLLDERTKRLHHGAAPSLPAAYVEAVDGMDIGPCAGSCGTAAYHAAPVVVSDIDRSDLWNDFRPMAQMAGVQACWSTPIIDQEGVVLGTISVYHQAPHVPTERERQLVERFTHLCAIALDHSRIFGSLVQSEERFCRVFDDNAAGMALLDLDGQLRRVNPALCRMLRVPAYQLVGRSFGELVHRDDRATLPQLGVARGDACHVELRFNMAGSAPLITSTTYSAVHDSSGAIVLWYVNVVDETDRKAAEQDRQARAAAVASRWTAEKASQAKSQFLTALAHEIRTPLHAVVGFGEMLRSGTLSPERSVEALDRMAGAAKHIVALVEDLSDVAAIEAKALHLRPRPVSIGPLLTDVHGLVSTTARNADVTVEIELPDGSPAANCDERRIRQVVLNLATNAIKYNRAGGRVVLRAEQPSARQVRIVVADDGPGIPKHLQHRLFVPFDRLGAERTKIAGSGLGLHVTKGLVEGMGGRLVIESGSLDGGTVACVTLPAVVPASHDQPVRQPEDLGERRE